MLSRLLDLSISLNGKQRLTVELDGDFRETWEELKDNDCDITVKRYRKKRSLDANAYAWVLIDKIAAKKRIPKAEVYRNAIREIGGVSDFVTVKKNCVKRLQETWTKNGTGWQVEDIGGNTPGWTNLILYYGSSVYDTKQMSDLIESLVQDAQALGIETKSPEYIKSLMEEYNAKFNHTSGPPDCGSNAADYTVSNSGCVVHAGM